MKAETRYFSQFRECAVRMVLDQQDQHEWQWAAVVSIAARFGFTRETARCRVRRSFEAE